MEAQCRTVHPLSETYGQRGFSIGAEWKVRLRTGHVG